MLTPLYPLPVPESLGFSAIALRLEHLDNQQRHADLARLCLRPVAA